LVDAGHPVPGLRLTVLVEQRPGHGCAAAYGFAAWLEVGEVVVLVTPPLIRCAHQANRCAAA